MADEQLYLDYEGLATFKGELNGVDLIKATGNGSAYTATIPNVTALKKGMIITIIPDTTSTATIPNLNVNGLGAKNIKQRITTNTSLTVGAGNESWMIANKPVPLLFDGTQWVTITGRASAEDLYGTVPLNKGGTGVTTLEELKALVEPNVVELTNATIDGTHVDISKGDTFAYYYRYGRVVYVRGAVYPKSSANQTFKHYQIATGFPKGLTDLELLTAYNGDLDRIYIAGLQNGALSVYADVNQLPAGYTLNFWGAYIAGE